MIGFGAKWALTRASATSVRDSGGLFRPSGTIVRKNDKLILASVMIVRVSAWGIPLPATDNPVTGGCVQSPAIFVRGTEAFLRLAVTHFRVAAHVG